RFAWPHVAAEVADCYEDALALGERCRRRGVLARGALRYGLAPSDLLPRVPAQRLASLEAVASAPPSSMSSRRRRLRALRGLALATSSLAGAALGVLALQRVGLARVAASLVASKPGLLAAGLGLMCAAMFVRGIAWHAILSAAPTWRKAK